MPTDKTKLLEAVHSVATELEPFNEQTTKKWAVRANLPSTKKPAEKLRADKHLGMPLAEKVMHHLWKELPLEGVFYTVVESGELLVDYSDLAPVWLLIQCVDDDQFDMEVVSATDEVLMSLDGQTLEQAMSMVQEMHQAGQMANQKVQVNEGTSEESFFKSKYEALKRVYNEVKPFK